jgi:hypothetical protein
MYPLENAKDAVMIVPGRITVCNMFISSEKNRIGYLFPIDIIV